MNSQSKFSFNDRIIVLQLRIALAASVAADKATSKQLRTLSAKARRLVDKAVQAGAAGDTARSGALVKIAHDIRRLRDSATWGMPADRTRRTRWLLLALAFMRGKSWNQVESKRKHPVDLDWFAGNVAALVGLGRTKGSADTKTAVRAWLEAPDASRFDLGVQPVQNIVKAA